MHKTHGRDDDAFLEDLAECANACRRAAADIDVVCEGGDVAEQHFTSSGPRKRKTNW